MQVNSWGTLKHKGHSCWWWLLSLLAAPEVTIMTTSNATRWRLRNYLRDLYVSVLSSVASFTKKVNQGLAKRPLQTNGRLANHRLTSLVKEATAVKKYNKVVATSSLCSAGRFNIKMSSYQNKDSGKSAVEGTRSFFKKKGALFQEELYLPRIFMPPWASWRYDCGWMASIWM